MEGSKRKVFFVVLPAMVVMGLVALVLSGALFESMWTFLVLPFLLLTPAPYVFLTIMSGGPYSAGPSQGARETSIFVTSVFGSTSLILPVFLHHIGKVPSIWSAVIACIGILILFASMVLYHVFFNSDDEMAF